jgi:Peptidase M15
MATSKNMKLYFILTFAFVTANLAGCTPQNKPPNDMEYQQWLKKSENAKNVSELELYLARQGVADVFDTQQLLRSDVRWRSCKQAPFIIPPKQYWPHITNTLRIVKQDIVPLVGPVEGLSVFRSTEINSCIRGARRSYHLKFHAIDMKPKRYMKREMLIDKLCGIYRAKGKSLNLGLGIYKAQRFHIDAAAYRTWGNDYRSTSSPCLSLVAPQHNLR